MHCTGKELRVKTRKIPMPFGKGYLDVTVTEENLQRIYASTDPPGLEDEAKEIESRRPQAK